MLTEKATYLTCRDLNALTQLYNFNWVFLYQTAVGRMLEELAVNNSYHLQEAVGEKEQLFTKSVRFKKLIRFLHSIII